MMITKRPLTFDIEDRPTDTWDGSSLSYVADWSCPECFGTVLIVVGDEVYRNNYNWYFTQVTRCANASCGYFKSRHVHRLGSLLNKRPLEHG